MRKQKFSRGVCARDGEVVFRRCHLCAKQHKIARDMRGEQPGQRQESGGIGVARHKTQCNIEHENGTVIFQALSCIFIRLACYCLLT